MNAETTLIKVKQFCLADSKDEQIWTNKGTTYHWNRGKDIASGLINGVVRKVAGIDASGSRIWVVAGSLKIDPSGEILRWTGMPRKLQITFEPVHEKVTIVFDLETYVA